MHKYYYKTHTNRIYKPYLSKLLKWMELLSVVVDSLVNVVLSVFST